MGVEILLIYVAMMLVLGPDTVIYGLRIIGARRVRLRRDWELRGVWAIFTGIITMAMGIGFTYDMWNMGRYFPH